MTVQGSKEAKLAALGAMIPGELERFWPTMIMDLLKAGATKGEIDAVLADVGDGVWPKC
jgi:hypothetical protein